MVDLIKKILFRLDGFEEQYIELIEAVANDQNAGLSGRWDALRRNELSLQRERENLVAAVRAAGPHETLTQALAAIDLRARELAQEKDRLEALSSRPLQIPESPAELRQMLESEFERLASDSFEFGDLLRQLVPEFEVYLVRLCDGGNPLPRARVRIDLAGSIEDADRVPGLKDLLTGTHVIDLFDPPQRELIREEAVRLAASGMTHRQIAAALPGAPPRRRWRTR